jgi:broad specificity phosphatase PhoE
MNDMTTIYLVRHGQSYNNAHIDRPYEQGGSSLTEKGMQEAQDLAEDLKKIHIDYIFSSDLTRAIQTAQIIAEAHHIQIQTSQALRERSYGSLLDGGTHPEAFKKLNEILDTDGIFTEEEKLTYKQNDMMESGEEMMKRFSHFLIPILEKSEGKTIVCVVHGNIMRTFLAYIEYVKHHEIPVGSVKNTGYVKLIYDGYRFHVQELSNIRIFKKVL